MRFPIRKSVAPAVLLCSLTALTACLSGGGSTSSSRTPSAAIDGVRALSNDPTLVSGGNVLVEVLLADSTSAAEVVVELNGSDVTSAFELGANDRFVGLVSGLVVGENTISAQSSAREGGAVDLVVQNHPSSGPIFSGPQLKPWVCAQPTADSVELVNDANGQSASAQARVSGLSKPSNADCSAAPEVAYYYQPIDAPQDCTFDIAATNSCFQPYSRATPPADDAVAQFTNDRGNVVRSILAVERGTLNRGMYSLAVFHDPEAPHHPADPQRGWNNKLVFNFGGGAVGSRFQTPPNSPFFNEAALRKGYMTATSSLTDHGTNSNHALSAETVMMLKEHIVEAYGPIRYTVGTGGSGGAIMQFTMASAYPGLLDGLIPNSTFTDALSNVLEIGDCGIFSAGGGYIDSVPLLERESLTLAYTGHSSSLHCTSWNLLFLPALDPKNAANCGAGFPAELVYHPTNNPGGVRCSHFEHNVNMLGTETQSDGVTRAIHPLDNQGVQYGLRALQSGDISPERFVHLNENIGYFNLDAQRVAGPERKVASVEVLERAYKSGMITHGRYLAGVPIIDIRHNEPAFEIHLNWRAKAVRERLLNALGSFENQLIWAFDGVPAPEEQAFTMMDQWLAAVEADDEDYPLAEKVRANKPDGASDKCLVMDEREGVKDVGLDTGACPVKFGQSPRQVAGGPVAEDILKCQLKPLDFANDDYLTIDSNDRITFSSDQQARLQAVFANGVCDWDKPGVAQEANPGWVSFSDGPDGVPMQLEWFDRP